MKVAVTYENGNVFAHFGHTKQFKIYEIEEGKIISEKVIATNGSGHGMLGNLLIENEVNVLISGGLGAGAKNILEENNIEVYPGVEGKADEVIKDFIAGNLKYDPNTKCNRHGMHHDHNHNCESHNCAEEKGGCTGNK